MHRVNISIEEFHREWIDKKKAEDDDFNFSEWVRTKIEEEANNVPVHI